MRPDTKARHDRPSRGVPRPSREIARGTSRPRTEAPHRSRSGVRRPGARRAEAAEQREPPRRARAGPRPSPEFARVRSHAPSSQRHDRPRSARPRPRERTGRREREAGRRSAEVMPTSAAPNKATQHNPSARDPQSLPNISKAENSRNRPDDTNGRRGERWSFRRV
jgi:hypothetical protein